MGLLCVDHVLHPIQLFILPSPLFKLLFLNLSDFFGDSFDLKIERVEQNSIPELPAQDA